MDQHVTLDASPSKKRLLHASFQELMKLGEIVFVQNIQVPFCSDSEVIPQDLDPIQIRQDLSIYAL